MWRGVTLEGRMVKCRLHFDPYDSRMPVDEIGIYDADEETEALATWIDDDLAASGAQDLSKGAGNLPEMGVLKLCI
jgi:hypothetical protein